MVSSVAERDTPPARGGGAGKDQAALADWLLRLDDVARKHGCEGLVAGEEGEAAERRMGAEQVGAEAQQLQAGQAREEQAEAA